MASALELALTLLIFKIVSRMLTHPKNSPEQSSLTDAVHITQSQMTELMTKAGLNTTTNYNFLSTTDSPVETDDMIPVHWT